MNSEHFFQPCSASAPLVTQTLSGQPSRNAVLDIDDYLRIVDPAARENSQFNSYQNANSNAGDFQSHEDRAIPSQTNRLPQGYYHSLQSQSNPDTPSQPAGTPQGYYPAVQSPPNPSRSSHASAGPYQNPFSDRGFNEQSDELYPANHQPRTPEANTRPLQTKDRHPRSKRAERRAKISDVFGSVGATDTPKGETRQIDGVKQWYDPALEIWCLAAPLDDYRRSIIDEDNARDSYAYPPDHGHDEDDITTFPLIDDIGQKNWHFHNRSSFDNIRDAEGNQVMYLLERPKTNIGTSDPDYMMYNGVILLDPDNWPILDWPGLPRCISSQIEGWRIEAFRRVYPWLALPHFRARMPRRVSKKSVGIKPLFGLSSLSQRVSRFREINDIPPWKRSHVAKGTDLTKHTVARLAEEGLEPDSTAGLEPLPRREVLQRKEVNKGKFPENVGLYTLSEEQRKEKEVREARRLEERNQRYQQDIERRSNSPSNGNKRRRDDEEALDLNDCRPQKRQQAPSGSAVKQGPYPSAPGVSEATNYLPNSSPRTDFVARSQHAARHTPPNHPASRTGRNGADQAALTRNQANVLPQPPARDLRHIAPRSVAEQVSIHTALWYTRADFLFFHGIEPPVTTNTSSYLSQYQEIYSYHQTTWFDPTSVPQLIGLSSWYGSFNAIPLPDVEEKYMQRLLPSFYENSPPFSDGITPLTAQSTAPPIGPPPTPRDGGGGSRAPPRIPTPFPENLFGDGEIDWSTVGNVDFSTLDGIL